MTGCSSEARLHQESQASRPAEGQPPPVSASLSLWFLHEGKGLARGPRQSTDGSVLGIQQHLAKVALGPGCFLLT